jgi:hypothetical protein
MRDEEAIHWREGFPQVSIGQGEQALEEVMGSFWFGSFFKKNWRKKKT